MYAATKVFGKLRCISRKRQFHNIEETERLVVPRKKKLKGSLVLNKALSRQGTTAKRRLGVGDPSVLSKVSDAETYWGDDKQD